MKRFLLFPQVLLVAFTATAAPRVCAQTSTPPAIHSVATSSSPAEKLKVAGVRNAGRVSDELYRGGQPTEDGLAELKKLGVTTIVNLRGNHGESVHERSRAAALGMHYIDIPVRAWDAPTDRQVAQFLQLFHSTQTQKIFVHCFLGEDRTGVMVATYRMAREGWSSGQALAEMDSFGFHYHVYRSMKHYVRQFPHKLNGDSVLERAARSSSTSTGY